jgi:hypothetical protein
MHVITFRLRSKILLAMVRLVNNNFQRKIYFIASHLVELSELLLLTIFSCAIEIISLTS